MKKVSFLFFLLLLSFFSINLRSMTLEQVYEELCSDTYSILGSYENDMSPEAKIKQVRINEINFNIGSFIEENKKLVNKICYIFIDQENFFKAFNEKEECEFQVFKSKLQFSKYENDRLINVQEGFGYHIKEYFIKQVCFDVKFINNKQFNNEKLVILEKIIKKLIEKFQINANHCCFYTDSYGITFKWFRNIQILENV